MKRSIILCMILLTACANTGQDLTPLPLDTSVPNTVVSQASDTPEIPPSAEPCAFVEATQNLPDVTAQVDKAIKELQPDASGRAEAFGENCVYASSGQSTFSAMETDFYITLNVKNLKDDNELGTWIINAMKIVDALPSGSIPGPQAGFVEFTFKTRDNQRILRVSIDKYKNLPADISPTDIIKTLFPNP